MGRGVAAIPTPRRARRDGCDTRGRRMWPPGGEGRSSGDDTQGPWPPKSETERRMVGARGCGMGGAECLMGRESRLGGRMNFWKWTVALVPQLYECN